MRQFILASASPRRKDILEFLGIPFEVMVSDFPEEKVDFGELDDPKDFALTIAVGKALSLADKLRLNRSSEALILGADTVVFLDGNVFGKPRNLGHARQILQKLRGKKHVVVTGFVILDLLTLEQRIAAVESLVEFFEFSDAELDQYIATSESLGKAGAYALQGNGKRLVRNVEGSVSNVIGLPVEEVANALEQLGVPVGVDARAIEEREFKSLLQNF